MADPLPCVICGRDLEPVLAGNPYTNQPHGGTTFRSHGHYGSTAFDPEDNSFLELNLCDPCLNSAAKRGIVLVGRRRRERRPPTDYKTWKGAVDDSVD